MKKYPKINGKNLDPLSTKKFDEIEEVVLNYLNMYNGKYSNEVIAYNLAFLLL